MQPTAEKGRTHWPGMGGGLHFELCRAVRRVLSGADPPAELSSRAKQKLAAARAPFHWLDDKSTAIVRDPKGELRWWTFVGLFANSALAELAFVRGEKKPNDFAIQLEEGLDISAMEREIRALADRRERHPQPPVNDEQAEGLKFEKCLPPKLMSKMLGERIDVPDAVSAALSEPLRIVTVTA